MASEWGTPECLKHYHSSELDPTCNKYSDLIGWTRESIPHKKPGIFLPVVRFVARQQFICQALGIVARI